MSDKRFVIESNFVYKGLRCVVIFGSMGHRCGYVGVPKSHILYGKDYNDNIGLETIECKFDVHGGITYAGGNDYPIDTNGELWWFGFDTAHYGDGKNIDLAYKYELLDEKTYSILKESESMFGSDSEVKSLDYCIEQCKLLADQFKEVK